MTNSELIQYTIQLRKQYYQTKQFLKDNQENIRKCKLLKPDYDFTSVERYSDELERKILIMKKELSQLPHIPNKNERRIIRQNKAKQKI